MVKTDIVYADADTFKILKNGTVKPERDLILYVRMTLYHDKLTISL